MDEISIIQGDSYEAKLRFSGISNNSVIESVMFSCSKLRKCKYVDFDEESQSYLLRFTPEETANFEPCVTDFDITIKYTDKNVQTPIYRKTITIFRKVNLCGRD